MKQIFILTFTMITVFVIDTCNTQNIKNNQDFPLIYLSDINLNPSSYHNKQVKMEGSFMGWSGENCSYISESAHQLTRSDWTFKDKKGNCIFVTKGKPEFLSPLANSDTGKKIRLTAFVKTDNSGKLYLEFISVESVE